MELRHLRYFVAVAERLSYRQAADRLHLSQPALSNQIRDLEEEIGVRLFDRNTRKVRLTEAGRVLLDEARLVLTRAQHAVVAAREAAAGRRGRLLVGNIAALSHGFLAPILEQFHAQLPDVDVTLLDLTMAEQVPALESRQIQVGFSMGPCPPLPPALQQVTLLRSPVRVMMGRAHRLAGLARVPLEDIAREVVLLISPDRKATRHHEQLRELFAPYQVAFERVKYVDGFGALVTMLASGRDVTVVPELLVPSTVQEVVSRPIDETGETVAPELRAIWREDESSPLVHNFISLLRSAQKGAGARSTAS